MITIPTLSQLYTQIISDIEAELGVTIPPYGRVFLRAMASVQAAKLKLFYLAIGFLQKNIFADTADSESLGGTLERFGRVKLNRNPFSAISGEYTVQVTGTIGALIPASSTFKSDDTALNPGELFVLDAAFTFTAPTETITLRALTAGLDSALEVADTLTATAPIALVDSLGEVTAISTNPQAAETLEEYRAKVIEAYRLEPQGGAASDYRLWSADAQGVQQTYIYSTSAATNEVDVFVEATDADSVPVGSGIPTAAMLTEVEDVIEFDPDTTRPLNERGRRPVQVIVNVQSILPKDIDIEITGYVGLTPAIQTTITAALTEYVDAIRPFVAGADVLADSNDTINVNGAIYTIQNAIAGANFTSVDLQVATVSVISEQFLGGDIPKINSVTFV